MLINVFISCLYASHEVVIHFDHVWLLKLDLLFQFLGTTIGKTQGIDASTRWGSSDQMRQQWQHCYHSICRQYCLCHQFDNRMCLFLFFFSATSDSNGVLSMRSFLTVPVVWCPIELSLLRSAILRKKLSNTKCYCLGCASVRYAGARNKEPGRLFIFPPSSSPESSSETGAVAFSGGCITIALASMLSSVSNRSVLSCKLKSLRHLETCKMISTKKGKKILLVLVVVVLPSVPKMEHAKCQTHN